MNPSRRLTLDVELSKAVEILARLEVPGRPMAIRRLDGGSTEVYRIDLADGAAPLVLKLYPDEPDWRPAKEQMVSGLLAGALDVPTPRCQHLDVSRELLPLRFALLTMVPGEPLRAWIGEPEADEVYRQAGALLRQVHRLPMTGYGYIKGAGVDRPFDSNRAYMAYAFESAFQRFRDTGGDAELARRLEALALANLHLTVSEGPVLCHDDLHPGNVLAVRDADGGLRLSALVDFGNARSADPLFDLAKAIFCSTHEDPRSARPLMEGYGPTDHPDPDGALWLYTLHHRVSMWAFLTRLGQPADDPRGPGGLIRDLSEMANAGRPAAFAPGLGPG